MVFCARLRGLTLSWRAPDGSKGMAQSDVRLVPLWRVGLSGMTLEPGRQARKLLQKSRLEIIRPQKLGQWLMGWRVGVSAINIQEEKSTNREDFLIVLVFLGRLERDFCLLPVWSYVFVKFAKVSYFRCKQSILLVVSCKFLQLLSKLEILLPSFMYEL